MELKQTILSSLLPILQEARYVRINQEKLGEFAMRLPEERARMEGSDIFSDTLRRFVPDSRDLVNLVLVMNSISFAFWSKDPMDKWRYESDAAGKELTGFTALFFAFVDHYRRDKSIIDGHFLSGLDRAYLEHWLGTNGKLLLMEKRAEFLRDTGRVMAGKYDNDLVNLAKKAEFMAREIIWELVRNFPAYDDRSRYEGREALFFKRAQLAVSTLAEVDSRITHADQLTAFADYKVPVALRELGILEYDEELERRIRTREFVFKDSRMELEIRASMIWAIEQLLERVPEPMTSAEIDHVLWRMAKQYDTPHHLTATTAY